jgi:hypothetical protein
MKKYLFLLLCCASWLFLSSFASVTPQTNTTIKPIPSTAQKKGQKASAVTTIRQLLLTLTPAPAQHSQTQDDAKVYSGWAVAALVLGILASISNLFWLFGGGIFAAIFGLLAIVCGILALNQIKRSPDKWKGSSMAIWGLVLGGLGVLLGGIWWIALLAAA